MKRSMALAVSVFLLTGCGGSLEQDIEVQPSASSEAPAEPAATTEAAELVVSPQTTCELMIGDDGGIVVEASQWLRDIEEINEETVAQAEDLSERLGGYAASAESDLAVLIETMQDPFTDFVDTWNGALESDTTWKLDGPRYQSASTELLNRCEPLLPEAAAVPEEPTALPTTGDFEADMMNAGLVVDDFDHYADLFIPRICESDLDSVLMGFTQKVRLSRARGEADDQLRLIAAYHCPDRLDELEEAFDYLDNE